MKKKKIVVILIIILIIILIGVAKYIIDETKEKTSVSEFNSLKSLIENDGHEYIKTESSKEDGFKKDIYIKFSLPAINENGETNKNLYEIVIKHVAGKIKGTNFRLIDTEKNIVVKIKFDKDKISLYTINDDTKYWEHIKANYQINNYNIEKISNFTITSNVLANIINANWDYNKSNLGKKESQVDNYDIYFSKGYRVRKIGKNIFNIVFTQNYNDELLDGLKPTSSKEEVERILGKPTYTSSGNEAIGYKCEYFYVFFTGKEASVYPADEYNEENSRKFGNLVTELNKTGDANTFLNKLTDLYPNYETFYKQKNYVSLVYPLKGFEVILGAESKNGLHIYSNFKGNITEDITIDTLRENKKMPVNVYTNLNTNLVTQTEEIRINNDHFNRHPYDDVEEVQTEDYTVMKEGTTYKFYSKDKSKIDSEIVVENITNIMSYNNTMFVYGVKNKGLFLYDAEKMKNMQLVEGDGEFKITKVENNEIYYDETKIQIQ